MYFLGFISGIIFSGIVGASVVIIDRHKEHTAPDEDNEPPMVDKCVNCDILYCPYAIHGDVGYDGCECDYYRQFLADCEGCGI